MKFILFPLNLFFLVAFISTSGRALNDRKHFKVISEYLTKTTTSDDINENLTLARKFLEGNLTGLKGYYQRKFNGNLIAALKLFVSLGEIPAGTESCDERSMQILKQNDMALEGTACKILDKPPEDRVESIVHRIALEHARTCRDHYEQQSEKVLSRIPNDTSSTMSEFIDLVLKSVFGGEEFARYDLRRLLTDTIIDYENPFSPDRRQNFISQLSRHMDLDHSTREKSERSSLYLIDKLENFKGACNDYLFLLGPIFWPLEFDERVLPLEPISNEKDFKFREAFANFKICQEFACRYMSLKQLLYPYNL